MDLLQAALLAPDRPRDGYKSILGRHVFPAFGHRKFAAISPADVQRFITEFQDHKGLAPNTIRRVMDVVCSVLRVAVERRYVAVNLLRPLSQGPRVPTRSREVTRDSEQRPC